MVYTDAIGHRSWKNKEHFLEYHENYTGRGNLHGSLKSKYNKLSKKQKLSYWNNILLNFLPEDAMKKSQKVSRRKLKDVS
jgi:hypothetical protein